MKKIFPIPILSFVYVAAFSQNIGIDINAPGYKLHVKGSINTDSVYRINGKIALSVEGFHNTFVGVDDLLRRNFTNSVNNTATGYQSLYANSSGNTENFQAISNTAIGYRALYANEIYDENTAAGYLASYTVKGNNNTAIGSNANAGNPLNPYGAINTATGFYALHSIMEASENVCYGANSLYSNTTGYVNAAVGYGALYWNDTGYFNTAIGFNALSYNRSSYNVASGTNALFANTTGRYNTVAGVEALHNTVSSSYNTIAGYLAANSFDAGSNNTVIGADAELAFDGQYNGIAIGNLATCPDNSAVRIGNSANWSYGGYANWTNFSDGRFKKNIQENVVGLRFILGLRPVIYQMNATALNKKLSGKEPNDRMKTAFAEKESMIWTGFIAQEVEAAATAVDFTFSAINKPTNNTDVYGLSYEEFVMPLVKALQEQQSIIESLQKELLSIKQVNRQLMQSRQPQNLNTAKAEGLNNSLRR